MATSVEQTQDGCTPTRQKRERAPLQAGSCKASPQEAKQFSIGRWVIGKDQSQKASKRMIHIRKFESSKLESLMLAVFIKFDLLA